MPDLPFGELMPDQADLENPGTLTARNVVPLGKDFGPLPALGTYSTALTARCQGAFAAVAPDGAATVSIFAGDATKLYLLGSTGTFADVTRVAGGAYTTPGDRFWSFAEFGNRVIATNGFDAPQSYSLGTSTNFAALAGSPPTARYVATVRDFVLLGNHVGADASTTFPYRVRWSAIGDATSWPTLGTAAAAQVQSDQQDLFGEGGEIRAIIGGQWATIVTERSIWRATYVGSPAVFQFDEIDKVRGTTSPGSVVANGPSQVFGLASDGFWMFDGMQVVPIGNEKLNRFFLADVDQTFLLRITAAIDPQRKLVFWSYPSVNGASGVLSHCLIYNYATNRWSYAEFDVELLMRSLTQGYTLEQLDAFGTLETLPLSLDSPAWSGGRIALAGFDTSHKFGLFSGSNLAATMTTTEVALAKGRRSFLNLVTPMVDGGTVTMRVGHRNRQIDAVVWSGSSAQNANGDCPCRVEDQYFRIELTVAAGGSWTHAMGANVPPHGVVAVGVR